MMMRPNSAPPARTYHVLVIDAHPRESSFCHALAEAAAAGATAASHEVRLLALRELHFDLNHRGQPLEPCLLQAQEDILWAQHLIIIHPVWWGSMPALLKGWLDRVLQPGFAFGEREDGSYQPLLTGRTATVISTLDTPLPVYRWLLGAPSVRALSDSTLRFCGIRPAQVLLLSALRHSTRQHRQCWLALARRTSFQLDHTLRLGWRPRIRAWLMAIRPQFYVFPCLALTAGAWTAAHHQGSAFQWQPWVLATLGLWMAEAITVFTNELHDQATDTQNRNGGPFTGGSRVLVQGLLSEAQLRRGRTFAAIILGLVSLLLASLPGVNVTGAFILLIAGLLLGIGYTTPPLKFAYRTLGEVVVAFTHSVLAVMLGHFTQGGLARETQPWLVAVPLFFAILPSITLAGFPDLEADAAVGKRTLAVRFGRRAAVALAISAAFIAAATRLTTFDDASWLTLGILVHASALALLLVRYGRQPRAGRMDGLLILTLSYMLWFAWPAGSLERSARPAQPHHPWAQQQISNQDMPPDP
ncbi:MAG: NAD(P)H-dependent oxidoreductase [Verrucomicrobiota bacterium]